MERPLDLTTARKRYWSQKHGARARGIGWELTFKEWLDWWGSDLDNRGNKPWNLQMQRRGDTGPYALWNITKGTPKDNSRTWQNVRRNRRAVEDAKRYQRAIDDMPVESEDYEPEDESISAYFSRDRNDVVIRRCKADVLGGRGDNCNIAAPESAQGNGA